MTLDDFYFDLPSELIARYPVEKRSASRLLCLGEGGSGVRHQRFADVIDLIQPQDLLVFNDTKVIPARLFGSKITGGRVEILVERILSSHRILGQIRASKPPRIDEELIFASDIRLKIEGRPDKFYEISYGNNDRTILEVIEAIGQIPLPPYMHRLPDDSDKERYQTVYAKHKGSVAAPTAGFHFDEELLTKLREKNVQFGYLTLHIGAGTFAPIRVENIKEHQMHAEYLEISAELCEQIKATKARGRRVISVGTTSLRALESAVVDGEVKPFSGETRIFIYPGHVFHSADALITNMHLPSSTLLMLTSAFGGYERVMEAYRVAVKENYRFYSYGDAMWMERGL